MHITVTRNFSKWAHQDDCLERLEVSRHSVKSRHTREQISQIRSLGMSATSLALIHAMMRDFCETGFASFSQIRFICWYWENGDKIIFPLNSINQLYLGNDSSIWCKFWPFLRQISLNTYECNLGEPDVAPICLDGDSFVLGLGGQSHFGHFVCNRVAALHQSKLTYPYISSLKTLLVPKDYLDLHKSILLSILGGCRKNFQEFPGSSGIYTFKNVVIPCIDEHFSAMTGLKGIPEKYGKDRKIKKDKRTYITRGIGGVNDRLLEFKSFLDTLEILGFDIVNPIDLSFSERLELIGDSEFILTDSGSCSINALLFGNSLSCIRQMLPRRVICSTEETVINQLCMGFNQGAKGEWLIIESKLLSNVNPWYDVCVPPSRVLLEKLLRNC